MPLCGGDTNAGNRTKAIERELRKDFANYRRELKLLLLGTGESGKSTIIKQMRILYGEGFSDQDRKEFAVLVYLNVLRALKAMIDAMDRFSIEFQDGSLLDKAMDVLDTPESTFKSLEPWRESFSRMWADPGLQKAFARRNEYQLSDSTPYFLNDLTRISSPDYVPTEQDVLRAREPTTGIHEYLFVLDRAVFRMLDVGGQRSERRKWIHCFENITSIIFIVAASEYDQFLAEAQDTNRMTESIAVFAQVSFAFR
jgi:hypothetical protein